MRATRWWQWSEKMPAAVRVPLQSHFIRFLIVGGINTVFGYGVFAILILLHVPYAIAAFLSTCAAVLFNFKSYGTLVFGSHHNRLSGRLILVYAPSYVLNVIPRGWGSRHHV